MKALTQKLFNFRKENNKKIRIANTPFYVKIGNSYVNINLFFEKSTVSDSLIKGYSFFEFATLKGLTCVFEGQEIDFYTKDKDRVYLTDISNPIIQWNDFDDNLMERYKKFKGLLCPDILTIFRNSKYANLEADLGYKIVTFETEGRKFVYCNNDEYCNELVEIINANEVKIIRIDETDRTDKTIEYNTDRFDFVYSITNNKITIL